MSWRANRLFKDFAMNINVQRSSGHTEVDSLPTPRRIGVPEPEAARIVGVSPRTMFGLAASGKIPYFKIGSRKLYDVADLQTFVDSLKTGGDTQ